MVRIKTFNIASLKKIHFKVTTKRIFFKIFIFSEWWVMDSHTAKVTKPSLFICLYILSYSVTCNIQVSKLKHYAAIGQGDYLKLYNLTDVTTLLFIIMVSFRRCIFWKTLRQLQVSSRLDTQIFTRSVVESVSVRILYIHKRCTRPDGGHTQSGFFPNH